MARRAGKGSCHSSTFGFDRRPCTCSFHGHHLWLLSSSLPLLVPWGALERDHVRAPAPAPPSSCSSPQPCPSLLVFLPSTLPLSPLVPLSFPLSSCFQPGEQRGGHRQGGRPGRHACARARAQDPPNPAITQVRARIRAWANGRARMRASGRAETRARVGASGS